MRTKKSLFAVAAMALAALALASSAMAVTEDKLVDVTDGSTIPENRELHFVGWAKFSNGFLGSFTCHVTSVVKVTGTTGKTGHVREFTVPDTTQCTGTGLLTGCKLEAHSATTTNALNEHTWHVTATETDADVFQRDGGELVLHIKYKNEGALCSLRGQEVTLTFPSVTLKPLKTNVAATTGTAGNIHELTAATGEPIAGVELSATGKVHRPTNIEENVTASGELELTSGDRCTWKFAAG